MSLPLFVEIDIFNTFIEDLTDITGNKISNKCYDSSCCVVANTCQDLHLKIE